MPGGYWLPKGRKNNGIGKIPDPLNHKCRRTNRIFPRSPARQVRDFPFPIPRRIFPKPAKKIGPPVPRIRHIFGSSQKTEPRVPRPVGPRKCPFPHPPHSYLVPRPLL